MTLVQVPEAARFQLGFRRAEHPPPHGGGVARVRSDAAERRDLGMQPLAQIVARHRGAIAALLAGQDPGGGAVADPLAFQGAAGAILANTKRR